MSLSTPLYGVKGHTPQFSEQYIAPQDVLKFRSDKETDEHRLENRKKQIQFGKNTIGYDNYIAAVPKHERKKIPAHPRTPDIHRDMSKRQFDGIVKAWRRALHMWDVPDARPDEASSTIKLDIKKAQVEFDDGRRIGQKRKMNNETFSIEDDTSSGNKIPRGEVVSDIESKFTIAEEIANDGYVSLDDCDADDVL